MKAARPRRRTPRTNELMDVYGRLLEAHGPRHWWPAIYGGNFEIVCGAILTQNTAWRNVEIALVKMRGAGYWSWHSLHAADSDELAQAIRPAGYHNTKSRKLKEFARVVIEEYDGSLDNLLALDMSGFRERLLGIWGIGEETADDIVLYAAKKPSFVIDKYTMRIVDRLGWKVGGRRYSDYQEMFTRLLPNDAALFNEYHALLDGHAARVCRTKPACDRCCLVDLCRSANLQT